MGFIGRSAVSLEKSLRTFTPEVFSSILKKEWIDEALAETGRQGKRSRKLPPHFMVWVTLFMGVYRTLSIRNVVHRMGHVMGLGSVWSDQKTPSSSSILEARDRLGFGPLRHLLKQLQKHFLLTHDHMMRWKGHLLLALDGTTFKMSDTPQLRKRFGAPGSTRGRAAYPQMRSLFLVSTCTHFVLEAMFAPYRRMEITLAVSMLPRIPKGALLLLDRHFNGWQFLMGILKGGSHFVIRARKDMHGKTIKTLAGGDRLVQMPIWRGIRKRCPELPRHVILREITCFIRGKSFRFLTSLTDTERYAADELVSLYFQRWENEIIFGEIKTHQYAATVVNRPLIFRSKTSRRVLQEAYAMVLSYNLIRMMMILAGKTKSVSPLRISFTDTLERIREAHLAMAQAPVWALPAIYKDLLRVIGDSTLPERRKRSYPRAVKIQISPYPVARRSA